MDRWRCKEGGCTQVRPVFPSPSYIPITTIFYIHRRMLVLTRRIVDKEGINDKPGMVAHEIGILKELNHENIVSFYDTFESKHKYVHFYQSD